MTAVTNGETTVTQTVILPQSITVEVAGAKLKALAVPTKKQGIKYECAQEKELPASDTRSFEEILASLVGSVKHDGVEVPVSKKYHDAATGNIVVRQSEPVRRADGTITGGGDPMISFWKNLPELGINGYTFRVTAKGVKKASGRVIRVTIAIAPSFGAKGFTSKGEIQGEMSL